MPAHAVPPPGLGPLPPRLQPQRAAVHRYGAAEPEVEGGGDARAVVERPAHAGHRLVERGGGHASVEESLGAQVTRAGEEAGHQPPVALRPVLHPEPEPEPDGILAGDAVRLGLPALGGGRLAVGFVGRGHVGETSGMRVVAGTARGRRLEAPRGHTVRPTSDRVREAVLNMVTSRVDLAGATVLDLFAGTGAMGIEALSRGAAAATFVDEDRAAVAAIRANLAATRVEGGRVVRADVLRFLAEGAPAVDVAFVDPPYAFDRWAEVFARLQAGLVVAESDRDLEPGAGWEVLKWKRHGTTVVTLAVPADPVPNPPTPDSPQPTT